MGFFTGVSKSVLVIFNAVLGLVAIAGIAGTIYCFAEVLIKEFARNYVIGIVLGGCVLLLLFSILGCVGTLKEKSGILACYNVFVFVLLIGTLVLGALASGYLVDVEDLSGGFAIRKVDVDRGEKVSEILDDLQDTFNNVYSSGDCKYGGMRSPASSPTQWSLGIQWYDVVCESHGVETALSELESVPHTEAEYSSWLSCMEDLGYPAASPMDTAPAQKSALWCRANAKLVTHVEDWTRILAIGAWVAAGVLFLVFVSVLVVYCKKRSMVRKQRKQATSPDTASQHLNNGANPAPVQGQVAVVYV